jgi:hypothetical protein
MREHMPPLWGLGVIFSVFSIYMSRLRRSDRCTLSPIEALCNLLCIGIARNDGSLQQHGAGTVGPMGKSL